MQVLTTELLTWAEICEKYPDSWVMIGYPETERKKHPNNGLGSVLYFDKDEDLFTAFSAEQIHTYKAQKAFSFYMSRFTGKTTKTATPKLGLFIKKTDQTTQE